MQTCDFLVIRSGIIGINIAKELLNRFPLAKIVLIDLNAVSHVFTCSIPFSKFVVDKIEILIKKEVK